MELGTWNLKLRVAAFGNRTGGRKEDRVWGLGKSVLRAQGEGRSNKIKGFQMPFDPLCNLKLEAQIWQNARGGAFRPASQYAK